MISQVTPPPPPTPHTYQLVTIQTHNMVKGVESCDPIWGHAHFSNSISKWKLNSKEKNYVFVAFNASDDVAGKTDSI